MFIIYFTGTIGMNNIFYGKEKVQYLHSTLHKDQNLPHLLYTYYNHANSLGRYHNPSTFIPQLFFNCATIIHKYTTIVLINTTIIMYDIDVSDYV